MSDGPICPICERGPFHSGSIFGNCERHRPEVRAASARLIASAPELLAALEATAKALEWEMEEKRQHHDSPAALATARALLTRIKGTP